VSLFNKRNQKGASAIQFALVVAGFAGVATVMNINRGYKKIVKAQEETKTLEARAEISRLLSVASFMVSNNLVQCREAKGNWNRKCRWVGASRDDADFRLTSFGFLPESNIDQKAETLNLDFNDDALTFARMDDNRAIKIVNGSMKFDIKSGDVSLEEKLKGALADRDHNIAKVDRDRGYIVVDLSLEYRFGADLKNTKKARLKAAFRRPFAFLSTVVTSDQCSNKCAVARSQNPNPSCRGRQVIDDQSVAIIRGKTTNFGPGSLYKLVYQKERTEKSSANGPALPVGGKVKLPVKLGASNILEPNQRTEWVDELPCKNFASSTNSLGLAAAPQHNFVAGSVNYTLGADTSLVSEKEPFRVNDFKLTTKGTTVPGLISYVYVAPTH